MNYANQIAAPSSLNPWGESRARFNQQNSWTAADESRLQAKRQADQVAWDKWRAANPQFAEIEETDEEDES